MNTKSFTFPYDTCEIPQKGIAQPYSVAINILICTIIITFLFFTKSTYAFLFLVTLLLFEFSHTFSHFMHIPGNIQFNITHFLAFISILALFHLFYQFTNNLPSMSILMIMIILFIADVIFIMTKQSFLFNIFSYVLIFLLLIISYLHYLPKSSKTYFYYMVLSIIFFSLIEINEALHCSSMLKWWPEFPYHIFVEIAGAFPVFFICKTFYDL